MKRLLVLLGILVAGAAVLSPAVGVAVTALGLDPLPGDFVISRGDVHLSIPVVYSLCASVDLALFYYLVTR